MTLRFVFVAPCVDEEFYLPLRKGASEAAAMLGVSFDFIGTADVDTAEQEMLMRQAVAAGCDGVALSIIDAAAFARPIQDVLDAGVPVVAFNVDDRSVPTPRLSAVCQNLYQAGRTLGERASGFINAGDHVLITMHSEGISALNDRARGIRDGLSTGDVTCITTITGTTPGAAAGVIAEQLRDDPAITAVLGTGLADTAGAGVAAGSSGRIRVAGFDVSPRILDLIDQGVIDCTVDQQPYLQGFYPVVQLTMLRRFGLQPSDIDTGACVITADDAASVRELSLQHYR